jgi:hypothetical protein
MDGELQFTGRDAPYLWQFTVPETEGRHLIRAVAHDHSRNTAVKTLEILSRQSEAVLNGGESRILRPFDNETFDVGDRVLVKAYLSEEDRGSLETLTVTARQKGARSLEIAHVDGGDDNKGAHTYTFIWDSAPAGTYELTMKIVRADGKIRFSKRVPIVVR